MSSFNFHKEWEFIIAETHNEKFRKSDLIKREILFVLQILLCQQNQEDYLRLKKIYYSEKSKQKK
jgi:hypothetical protein